MEKIIILDFSTGEVCILNYFGDEDAEYWLKDNGFNPDNCQWIIVDTLKLTINL